MESAHTPLPWLVGAQNDILYILDGKPRPAPYDGPIPVGDGPKVLCTLASENDAANAELIVRAVNSYHDMLAALENVRAIIAEAAQTGFQWNVGDWAERLFLSQRETSAAIAKAKGE